MLLLLIVLSLCFCGTVHAADMTKEEAYTENLSLLDLYLQADPAAGVDINTLCSNFQGLGNYRCSMEFWLYASVLSSLEREEYNEALRFYNVLTLYADEGSSFTNLFADSAFTDAYPAIRPIDEMEQYIQARKEESAGNQAKAAEHFEKCLKFFDSRSRYQLGRPDLDLIYAQILTQLKDGDYAAAMENAQLLMSYGYEGAEDLYFVAEMQLAGAAATPAPQKTSTPDASFTLTGGADKGKVTLRWEKVPGAAQYRIYHAVINHGEKNFSLVTETGKTVIGLTQTEAGVNNYYYAEALDGEGNVIAVSEEVKVYVGRQQAATPKPTPKPTPGHNPDVTFAPNQNPVVQPTPGHSSDDDVITNENGDSPAVDSDLPAKPSIGFDDNQNSDLEDWWNEGNLPTAAPSIGNDDFDWDFDI